MKYASFCAWVHYLVITIWKLNGLIRMLNINIYFDKIANFISLYQ